MSPRLNATGDGAEEPDHVLLERSRDDPDAFGTLFERHFDKLFGYVYRRLGDWDAARDVTSEVFLKALRARWRFRWRGVPVSSWLYAIATNEVRMYLRGGRRAWRSHSALLDATPELDRVAPDAESERLEAELQLRDREEFVRARDAILELPIKYQEVLTLRFFEEQTYAEIAAILGKREGTVKSLLSRGLVRLRRILNSENSHA